MRSRILIGSLYGAIGGFLGFLLQEWRIPHVPDAEHGMTAGDLGMLGIYVGAMLGLAIGAVEGTVQSSPRLLARGAALGAIIGAVGGLFGAYFGGVMFQAALMGKTLEQLSLSTSFTDFVHLIVARTFGWGFLGVFPGLAAGAATRSVRRAWHGLIGGLMGGLLGGLLFDPLGKVVGPLLAPVMAVQQSATYDGGGPSRALGITVIGLATGFFIGLVEELLKQAWVRVLVGRNEGKDYIISKALTVLGRDERADVPLYGDPTLAPQHAAIRMERHRHVLLDGGAPQGSIVNGQPVDNEQLLRDGDMIQLGQVRLLFREKATQHRVARQPVDAQVPASQTPGAVSMPAHLCPFCGAPKDASGNCLCTVPGVNPTPAAPVGVPAAPTGAGYTAPQAAPYAYPLGGGPAGPTVGSRLLALDGPYAGQAFELAPGNLTVGRDPGNTIALVNDSTVSRRHAHIAEEAGQHVVYDDGSSNGTFVNSVRITVQGIRPGDVVQFGASKFRYD